MNIVVFGAAGKAGSRIVKEAARRVHRVVAVARRTDALKDLPPNVPARLGDATDPRSVRELAQGADAIVLAIGGNDPSAWRRAAQAVVETVATMPGHRPRILHMGGGATLLDPDGVRFLDSPSFPAAFRASATGQAEALDYYRALRGSPVTWTYVSPPPIHFEPGERTGRYRTGEDHPVADERGKAEISYEDFAIAIVDEIERPRHSKRRFTVGY